MLHTLNSFLDRQEEFAVQLQRELVARPALGPDNGGQGEQAKAEYLTSVLKSMGVSDIRHLPAPDSRVDSGERPNLMAVIPGRDSSQTLWIVSHLDIVPPGDLSLWDTDPYALNRQGDLLIGRGVEDNHHGLVASLLTAKAFLDQEVQPSLNLGLLFVADEETGNTYGLDYIFRTHAHLFQDQDQFLVPDFGGPDSSMLEVSEKGLMWLKITVQGRQCHASTPQVGRNSLLAAARLICALRELYSIFDAQNALFDPPYSTFEATKIEANVPNVNTIPGRDVFYLDCRVLPDYDLNSVIQAVQAEAQKIAEQTGQSIQVDSIHQQKSSSTDTRIPLISRLQKAIAAVYAVKAQPQGIGGGTVAAYPRMHGYPAVVWATLMGNAHQPNERTSIRNILNDAKVMTHLFLE